MLTIEKQVLILASASPRRQELLREAGIAFETHPAHIPEERLPGEAAVDYAKRLSREKALAVARHFADRFVLGADTIVVVDEHVLEKPLDHNDAARMLRLLSGRVHKVITGVSVLTPAGIIDTRTCTTQVNFRKLTEQEIQNYVASQEPMDKAGAYAIQGGAAKFANRMDGEYSNVVGLPLLLVAEMLKANQFM
jgi:nucleoside triphosphate pyrophosphatase